VRTSTRDHGIAQTDNGTVIELSAIVRTAAIIAGGQGRRLGGVVKRDLLIGGTRILDRQLSVLGQVAEQIVIVANDPVRFRGPEFQVCADRIPGGGALSGLHTALVSSTTAETVVVACDLPFLTAPFLRYLIARAGQSDAVIPWTSDGPQPLCALYTQACVEPIQQMLAQGERRVSALTTRIRVEEIREEEITSFDPHGMLFFNVNTPGDHRRANALTARGLDPVE